MEVRRIAIILLLILILLLDDGGREMEVRRMGRHKPAHQIEVERYIPLPDIPLTEIW